MGFAFWLCRTRNTPPMTQQNGEGGAPGPLPATLPSRDTQPTLHRLCSCHTTLCCYRWSSAAAQLRAECPYMHPLAMQAVALASRHARHSLRWALARSAARPWAANTLVRPKTSGSIEEMYQRKTPVEHVLLRPGQPNPNLAACDARLPLTHAAFACRRDVHWQHRDDSLSRCCA